MSVPVCDWVEVVYALPERQFLRRLPLRDGLLASEAVEASGVYEEWPQLREQALRLAVFGEPIAPDTVLSGGDRVELLRPLRVAPREARRKRLQRARRPQR